MTEFDLTTLGEGGLRLSVPAGERLRAADTFDVHPIGAELNVAGSLARLGWRTAWASSVREGPIGDRIVDHARGHGIDTSLIHRPTDGRTGVYYVEYGRPPLPTSVHYDRSGTTFSDIDPGQLDWDRLLDTRIVHVTGITLGLGGRPRDAARLLIERAKSAGIPISVDVNHRKNLWTAEEAAATLNPLLPDTTVLSCSATDAEQLFGIVGEPLDQVIALRQRFGVEIVMMSQGSNGVVLVTGDDAPVTAPSRVSDLVDRLGAGDGLAAGALHAWLANRPERMADFGSVGAGLALVQQGETLISSAAELERLADQPATELNR